MSLIKCHYVITVCHKSVAHGVGSTDRHDRLTELHEHGLQELSRGDEGYLRWHLIACHILHFIRDVIVYIFEVCSQYFVPVPWVVL